MTKTTLQYISMNPAENGWVLSINYITNQVEQEASNVNAFGSNTQKSYVFENHMDMLAFLAREFGNANAPQA